MRTSIALAVCMIGCGMARAADPWNIVAIVTDDQGRWAVGAHGNSDIKTPNMDRIAREGAMFTRAFVNTPVCSPSRAAYMTGQYPTQVGITDYISPSEQTAGVGLPNAMTTWPEVLQKNGYKTGLCGKWHLGAKPEQHPTRRGFHSFMGALGGGFPPMRPVLEVDGKPTQLEGAASDRVGDAALQFIDHHRNHPFALCVHFREPHTPYTPMPDEDTAALADLDPTVPRSPGTVERQLKTLTRQYYAAIHAADRNIGRILAKLDERGLAGKTIVLFTSDHGYNIGHHGIETKGNGVWMAGGVYGPKRPNMWDTSLEVPLFVRWPGVVKPGMVIDAPVANIDTFASVCGMLGVSPPPTYHQQGLDWSPWLRGDKPAQWRTEIFGQYDLHNSGLAYMRMVRTEQWKLVRHLRCFGLDEIYDLKADPGELKNRFGTAPAAVKKELNLKLRNWMKEIGDPMLGDLPE